MVGLLHHRPDNPLDFIDMCLERVREIGWTNVRWNTFVEEIEGSNLYEFSSSASVYYCMTLYLVFLTNLICM